MLDLDLYIAEHERAPFEFVLGGVKRTLPHPTQMTPRQALKADTGGFVDVLRELADDETADAILDTPAGAVEELFKAWLEFSQVKPGESQASTDS